PPAAPGITVRMPTGVEAGVPTELSATAAEEGVPALAFAWDLGDGTHMDGDRVTHVYTKPGTFAVRLRVDGVDGVTAHRDFSVKVGGKVKHKANAPPRRTVEMGGGKSV